MRTFTIVGAGPTGGVLAACLSRTGHTVRVVDVDSEHVEAIRESGLRAHGAVQVKAPVAEVESDLSDLSSHEPEFLCVATKTSAFDAILRGVRELAGEDTVVVSVQNGLDNEDYLAEQLPGRRVCRIVVNWAGNLESPGVIHAVFFHAPNYVGAQSPESAEAARDLAAVLSHAGLETEYTETIKRHEWEKTLLNGAMSTTSALTGLNMMQVMEDPDARACVESLLVEGIEVARAAGVELAGDILDASMNYLGTAGPHMPSLAVDLAAGRATEIDFLNGRIVENARALGLDAPRHEAVTRLIRAAEARRRSVV